MNIYKGYVYKYKVLYIIATRGVNMAVRHHAEARTERVEKKGRSYIRPIIKERAVDTKDPDIKKFFDNAEKYVNTRYSAYKVDFGGDFTLKDYLLRIAKINSHPRLNIIRLILGESASRADILKANLFLEQLGKKSGINVSELGREINRTTIAQGRILPEDVKEEKTWFGKLSDTAKDFGAGFNDDARRVHAWVKEKHAKARKETEERIKLKNIKELIDGEEYIGTLLNFCVKIGAITASEYKDIMKKYASEHTGILENDRRVLDKYQAHLSKLFNDRISNVIEKYKFAASKMLKILRSFEDEQKIKPSYSVAFAKEMKEIINSLKKGNFDDTEEITEKINRTYKFVDIYSKTDQEIREFHKYIKREDPRIEHLVSKGVLEIDSIMNPAINISDLETRTAHLAEINRQLNIAITKQKETSAQPAQKKSERDDIIIKYDENAFIKPDLVAPVTKEIDLHAERITTAKIDEKTKIIKAEKKAIDLFKVGNFRKALLEYNILLSKNHNNIEYLRQAGLCHYWLKEYNDSLKYLLRAVVIGPKDPKTYVALGDVYFAIKNYNNALIYAKEAVRLAPDVTRYREKVNIFEEQIKAKKIDPEDVIKDAKKIEESKKIVDFETFYNKNKERFIELLDKNLRAAGFSLDDADKHKLELENRLNSLDPEARLKEFSTLLSSEENVAKKFKQFDDAKIIYMFDELARSNIVRVSIAAGIVRDVKRRLYDSVGDAEIKQLSYLLNTILKSYKEIENAVSDAERLSDITETDIKESLNLNLVKEKTEKSNSLAEIETIIKDYGDMFNAYLDNIVLQNQTFFEKSILPLYMRESELIFDTEDAQKMWEEEIKTKIKNREVGIKTLKEFEKYLMSESKEKSNKILFELGIMDGTISYLFYDKGLHVEEIDKLRKTLERILKKNDMYGFKSQLEAIKENLDRREKKALEYFESVDITKIKDLDELFKDISLNTEIKISKEFAAKDVSSALPVQIHVLSKAFKSYETKETELNMIHLDGAITRDNALALRDAPELQDFFKDARVINDLMYHNDSLVIFKFIDLMSIDQLYPLLLIQKHNLPFSMYLVDEIFNRLYLELFAGGTKSNYDQILLRLKSTGDLVEETSKIENEADVDPAGIKNYIVNKSKRFKEYSSDILSFAPNLESKIRAYMTNEISADEIRKIITDIKRHTNKEILSQILEVYMLNFNVVEADIEKLNRLGGILSFVSPETRFDLVRKIYGKNPELAEIITGQKYRDNFLISDAEQRRQLSRVLTTLKTGTQLNVVRISKKGKKILSLLKSGAFAFTSDLINNLHTNPDFAETTHLILLCLDAKEKIPDVYKELVDVEGTLIIKKNKDPSNTNNHEYKAFKRTIDNLLFYALKYGRFDEIKEITSNYKIDFNDVLSQGESFGFTTNELIRLVNNLKLNGIKADINLKMIVDADFNRAIDVSMGLTESKELLKANLTERKRISIEHMTNLNKLTKRDIGFVDGKNFLEFVARNHINEDVRAHARKILDNYDYINTINKIKR